MSLDVYLKTPGKSESGSGIFIRENGSTREITRAEWDAKFSRCEPVVWNGGRESYVFEYNITHNLGDMADAAGIYFALWRPHELMDEAKFKELRKLEEEPRRKDWYDQYTKIEDSLPRAHAADLIGPLADGLAMLKNNPEKFKALNPTNGWGDYEGLVKFVEQYLEACKIYPHAEVSVSR